MKFDQGLARILLLVFYLLCYTNIISQSTLNLCYIHSFLIHCTMVYHFSLPKVNSQYSLGLSAIHQKGEKRWFIQSVLFNINVKIFPGSPKHSSIKRLELLDRGKKYYKYFE